MLYMGLACPASGSSPHDERVRASASASAPHKAGMSIDHIVRARSHSISLSRAQIHAVESALDDLNTPAAQDALEDSLQAWHRLQRDALGQDISAAGSDNILYLIVFHHPAAITFRLSVWGTAPESCHP